MTLVSDLAEYIQEVNRQASLESPVRTSLGRHEAGLVRQSAVRVLWRDIVSDRADNSAQVYNQHLESYG